MIRKLTRPFRPVDLDSEPLAFFQLTSLGDDLKQGAEYAESGVCSIAIARDEHVTIVLVAARRGTEQAEHRLPAAGTLIVLSGRLAFEVEGSPEREELSPGGLAVLTSDLCHGVEALEDSTYLLIIGGRERPATAATESGREAAAPR